MSSATGANPIVKQRTLEVQTWPIDRLKFYERNPRKNDSEVERMMASIVEFSFAVPVLARSSGEIVDGHLRTKAARRLGMTELPVVPCDDWTDAQVRAFRLMVNRSVSWADWDLELLAAEFKDLEALGFDLALTGFDAKEIDGFTLEPDPAEDEVPPIPEVPVSRPGDLWLCGPHRVLCGSATNKADVDRVLNGSRPFLMVTDPPYGVELDSEWRDRAGINKHGPAEPSYMKHRTEGHTETSISGDTKADWTDAFELVPSLEIAYVWHATSHMVEVSLGLRRIGFEVRQQIIWNKSVFTLSRQAYHWKHEPCLYAVKRGKTARWVGTNDQSTVWDAASPKAIMGGSTEEKLNHATQKPVELMRRPILNHTSRGDLVWEPFLGSGSCLAAAETAGRVCYGIELEPKYIDLVVNRWQNLSGHNATLEGDGSTFSEVRKKRFAFDS